MTFDIYLAIGASVTGIPAILINATINKIE
ncbi:MAG: hypothetical protein RLZZ493_1424 [Bacteroidota bacterium]|jgi:hypothetical protein